MTTTGKKMIKMDETDIKRVKVAMGETVSLMEKELSYSEDLRKQDYLASLRGHFAKLQGMLDSGEKEDIMACFKKAA